LSPKHAKADFTLGNIYSELEKYEQAVDAYKKAVKLNPRDAAARYHLGVSYMQLRKQLLTSARKEYNALRKLDKDLAKDLEGKIKGK
jgi:Flp pilus assembly protein TadD